MAVATSVARSVVVADRLQHGVGLVGLLLVREVEAREHRLEQPAREAEDRQVRRQGGAVGLADRARLDRRERVAAARVGLAAPPAEVTFLVAPVRAGLPDLDETVRHRLTGAIEHLALDADRAGSVLVHEQRLRHHPELEERPDRLRGRARQAHAFSSGVAPLPPSTMS